MFKNIYNYISMLLSFHRSFAFPPRKFAFAQKTFVRNMRREEELYFSAFANKWKVSQWNVMVRVSRENTIPL